MRAADITFAALAGTMLLGAAFALRAADIYKSVDANGNVVYSDHLDPSTPQTEVHLEDSRSLPHVLHFCWTDCFTLMLDNGVYRRVDGTDESWTVEAFDAHTVVLHRHDAPADWNGDSRDVVYAGQVANDRLIGVTVNGQPVSGVDASWGTALNTLPANDAERDAPVDSPADQDAGGEMTSASAPPPVPEEDQPTLSEDGLLWTPGYWQWQPAGFFWVHGAWVQPPRLGLLWTPAYWGTAGQVFVFHPGQWGSAVGFYGGTNYGYGYFGSGYTGGHWIGTQFAYNSTVNHVDPAIVHHVYAASPSIPAVRGVQGTGPARGAARAPAHPSAHPSARIAAPSPSAAPPERSDSSSASRPIPAARAPDSAASAKAARVPAIRGAPLKQ